MKYVIYFWHGYNYELTMDLRAAGCVAESDDKLYYSGSLDEFSVKFPHKFIVDRENSYIAVTHHRSFGQR